MQVLDGGVNGIAAKHVDERRKPLNLLDGLVDARDRVAEPAMRDVRPSLSSILDCSRLSPPCSHRPTRRTTCQTLATGSAAAATTSGVCSLPSDSRQRQTLRLGDGHTGEEVIPTCHGRGGGEGVRLTGDWTRPPIPPAVADVSVQGCTSSLWLIWKWIAMFLNSLPATTTYPSRFPQDLQAICRVRGWAGPSNADAQQTECTGDDGNGSSKAKNDQAAGHCLNLVASDDMMRDESTCKIGWHCGSN
ncbi:hypothetical protein Zm00014a_042616 [Zea mays]|uniref:Uncharacterized protein n=1 Tax=Zea mays TaxID=4577 RepID=A0A3L6DRE0_MAIZE|nr:hypothetical protein Zm00014a_042616 [Zea mays]